MNKFFIRKYASAGGKGDEITRRIESKMGDNPYKALGSAPGNDAIANLITGGPTGKGLGSIGHLIAYAKSDPKNSVNPDAGARLSSFIPGVGGYRTAMADRTVDEILSKGKRSRSAAASERFGGILNSLIWGGVGTAVLPVVGTAAGLGISSLANIAGYLGGYARKPRTAKEHADYLADDNLVLKNLLIPGRASYQRGRRARQRYNAI